MAVRHALFALGYRYRLHSTRLEGKPDLVFPSRKKVIFIHGCFWHRHEGCKRTRTPKTRLDYWEPKFAANVARDAKNQAHLLAKGWRFLIVWECELAHMDDMLDRLVAFLEDDTPCEGVPI
jgi:DNA mismatch endonuclease (patch repair protein)